MIWYSISCLYRFLPDEEHIRVGRLLEAGLFDGVPSRQGVENLQQSHSIGDPRDTLEGRVDHVRVHDLIKENGQWLKSIRRR